MGSALSWKKTDFHDVGLNEHQMSTLEKSEAFTREREREIVQVVESVDELAQIMKDLSVLVIDQGTVIDWIDYSAQNVSSSVEEAINSYRRQKEQREKGEWSCVPLCFIMLVLLLLKTILF